MLPPLLSRARAWLLERKGYVLAGLAVLLVVGYLNRQRLADAYARAAASSAGERDAAAAAGVAVAAPAAPAALDGKVEALERANAQLKAELARARKAVPGTRPVSVVSASTAPAPVTGAVAAGEKLRLELEQVDLRGKGGARLLVGTMAARRAGDGELLLREPFQTPLAVALEEAPAAPEVSRWGFGPLGGLSTSGPVAGGLLATPSARVPWVGWKVEAVGIVAGGPGGLVGLGGIVVRP